MRAKLAALIQDVQEFEFTNDIYFIGGTALELHINHRASFDIDLATVDRKLSRENINDLVLFLQGKGRQVEDILSISDLHDSENEGFDLRDFQQDFSVDMIKLTVFTYGDNDLQRSILIDDDSTNCGKIKMATVNAIFKLKCLVLIDRHKSRDVFDLYYLVTQKQYSVADIFQTIGRYKPDSSLQIAKVRLSTADFPLTDEGYDENDAGVTKKEIADFFNEEILRLGD